MNEEMIKKAKEAKSVEELLALAKANNLELTGEQAKAFFAQLHPASGELADDELDAVAGGGCGGGVGETKRCPQCGEKMLKDLIVDDYFCLKCNRI